MDLERLKEENEAANARALRQTLSQIEGVLKATLHSVRDPQKTETLSRQHAGLLRRFQKLVAESQQQDFWLSKLELVHSLYLKDPNDQPQ